MSKNTNQPNPQRRLVIQGAVLSATALAVPGISTAASTSAEHSLVQANDMLDANNVLSSDAVSIELIESKVTLNKSALARVTVTNNSDRALKLKHLSPGTVATQSGVYQLNARLKNNPIAIRPNGVYQFWLEKDDGTQALLSHKIMAKKGEGDVHTMLEVTVVTETESGKWLGTQRVQAIIT